MSPDRILCYAPQRAAVVEFLYGIGGIVSSRCPVSVTEREQLQAADHITFIVIDGHPSPIPQAMWDTIVAQGAIVIHVDDQFVRSKDRKLFVRHIPGECSAHG